MGCILVVGNPYGATTHTDLRSRLGIPIIPIYSLIMNTVGTCGLQLYTFGQAVSIVFTDTRKPNALYDRIKENVDPGLHTLVLLDIRESSSVRDFLLLSVSPLDVCVSGRKICELPRYMSGSSLLFGVAGVEGQW
ncbi:hypothetical protein ARMGADRAFT_478442 [Armillaria gallica]|uniref:Tetrapyrrole methylase domain-containing protein n=1 Tax=Armillaria gallica TaxID=47427 RepID=A0A2H3D5L3_ARMGA|nr:hypothetical protein ARMGADRAFT_478442 [Armillaria gallica]